LGDTFQDFLTEAEHLQSKYADQISLLVGLETDYITSVDLERTTDLLDQHETIQYIVGSVHHVQGVSIDFDRNTWLRSVWHANADTTSTTMTLNPDTKLPSPTPSDNSNSRLVEGYIPSLLELRAFLMKYFDAQYDMLQSLRPEVVGHFDLCLLWTPEVCLVSDGMEEVWERVVRNVDFVIGYGGLFEANAAALRKGWRTCYPGQDILKVCWRV
jgi:histidinol-phosphatase (PHP family)